MATQGIAETIRIATFSAPLSRDGPGLLLRDIGRDDDQIAAIIGVIKAVQPDILLLTDIDHDHDALALTALNDELGFDHQFTAAPNAGLMTDQDLDQNSYLGEARDAQGYGRFHGDGGMAILSRWPIGAVTDHSDMLWIDLPGATLPQGWPDAVNAVQRLSSVNHWIAPIRHPDGVLNLMAYAATPPVFDGPEDRNGLRNRDELRLWTHILDTDPPADFVILGNANLDPIAGEGLRDAMVAFLADPRLQDPVPSSPEGGIANAMWDLDGPGHLRVSYVLPSTSFKVVDAGVFWPGPGTANAALLGDDGLAAGVHRLVWVDLRR